MRVLVVAKGPPERGGIAAVVQQLEAGLQAHHEVELLNLTRAVVPEGGRLSLGNIRRTVADARQVWRTAHRWDVVDIHSALAPLVTTVRAGMLAAAARARGARVIVHVHGGNLGSWMRGRVRRALTRIALAPAHVVIAVSEGTREPLATILDAGRLRLIENGVDVDRFRHAGAPHEPPRVLYVGLLTPRKGVVDLLEASEILRRRGVEHDLLLAGGVPDEGPAAQRQVEDAAGPEVQFLGARPHEEMPAVYAAGDVFCLPSWWEAMPLSILEAMATGLPVVASDVGDIPRIVVHGETGLLVPPRRPNSLADALQALIEDPERRRRMGEAGRSRAEQRYSVAATADAFCDLLSSLCPPR